MNVSPTEAYFCLIEQLLNCASTAEVQQFLTNNQELLDETFADILYQWAIVTFPTLESGLAYRVAVVIGEFSRLIQQFSFGNRRSNLEIAIKGYQAVVSVFTPDAFLEKWAMTQMNLGNAYCDRIKGKKVDNLELAITAYNAALKVYTPEAFPDKWAMTLNHLGAAYRNRIKGKKDDNLELAIAAYNAALKVYTPEVFPYEWASTQINLGNAYIDSIKVNKVENVEAAIACYYSALKVYTPDTFSYEWGRTQNSLGTAYWNRIEGERAENLEVAISAYNNALKVYTLEAFPYDWASTQNNLGIAYRDRIEGKKADNLEKAIAYLSACSEVYTPDAFPYEWALMQENLGTVYWNRIEGKRAANLEKAIVCYREALKVYTPDTFPYEWAWTQKNLGNSYWKRVKGERAENLEVAISAYNNALKVYTLEAFPYDWAGTQNNLGIAYRKRIIGEKADNLEVVIDCYREALKVYTLEALPYEWARTQNNLGNAYSNRIREDKADNLEQAIACLQKSLKVYTLDTFPYEWARTQQNLGNAYSNRIRGDKADNREKAIAACQQALKVFSPKALPVECRQTAYLLGNLYTEENRWSDATHFYQLSLEAHEVLYKASLSLAGKEEELAATDDLFHRTAYALARAGHLKLAAVTLELGRARSLSETLARDRSDLKQVKILAPEFYESYQQAASLLRNLEEQERIRSTLEEKNQVSVTPEGIRQQALQTRQALNDTIEQIRKLRGYENFLALPTFKEISQALKPNEPLIYITTTEYGSLALIVQRTSKIDASVESLRLDALTDAELSRLLVGAEEDTEFMGWFKSYNNRLHNRQAWQAWLDTIDRVTNELWLKLMESVINHLKKMKMQQAILIPTGLLGLLPLHAAWKEDLDKPCGRYYALDEILLTYAPNARSLITAREIATRISHDALLAVDDPRPVKANELPNSKREVQTAIETFPKHQVFKHEQATQQAIKNALSDHSVFHFSCHGYANLSKPLNSGLLMANDEILSLRDLFDLRLDGVRLAVLSACETALPGIKTIDEVINLPTGMLQAGVAGVVASLWSVSERSTMLLLFKFYKLWREENFPPNYAFCQAQIWLRESTESEIASLLGLRTRTPNKRSFAHPYYWAAFSYTGV